MIKAEYIDHMGDDLRVANAARVSFAKEGDGGDKDARLISFLAREGHFTPFTHCMITLRETVPIFVARQRFKHVVGFTYNEVSRRYVDDEPEFYEPETWRKRADNVKQGSGGELMGTHGFHAGQWCSSVTAEALLAYRKMIELGVAPEQARMMLPQSMLTSYYVTGSLSAFARAYSLRTHKTAQRETQELAAQWDQIIKPLFPVSWAALTGGMNDDDG